jgi:hypothetical protein
MSELVESPDHSKLVFVTSQQSMERLEVDRLRRVREPVSRSKSGIQGKVADVVSGRSRHAESQNELRAFRVLLATAHPDAWQEQPFVLEYHHDGAKHRYTPDILVVWGSTRQVVEIKDDSDADLPENRVRFDLIRGLLAEHGYEFRLWKRSEIWAEPRLTNVDLILRYRCVEVSAAQRERIRQTFSVERELRLNTLSEIPGITIPNVLRVVLEGTLHIDWWEPLGLQSTVSLVPLGRQVWPTHPATPFQRLPLEVSCR